jgi:hypothetical protein
MAGDYLHLQYQNTRKVTDLDIVVGTQNYADVITPKSANHQIFIQKITLSITTHFDGTITFDDDGAGPPIAVFTDEATVVPTVPSSWTWDFGPSGRPITKGANLDVTQSAAGIVGIVHIEAFEKLIGPVAQASTN